MELEQYEWALRCYEGVFERWEECRQLPMYKLPELGEVYLKAGKIRHYFNELSLAKEYFLKSLDLSKGVNIKERVKEVLEVVEDDLKKKQDLIEDSEREILKKSFEEKNN